MLNNIKRRFLYSDRFKMLSKKLITETCNELSSYHFEIKLLGNVIL
jgi:hypothetical protein